MIPLSALLLALPALAALLTVLSIAIVLRRAWRRRVEQRAEDRAAPLRPALLAIIGGDAEDEKMISSLASLDAATWRVIEPTLVSMLGKVRGVGRDMLVRLLRQRGVVARAMQATGRRGAVRRCRSADLLGAVGAREAVPVLEGLLEDADPEVRLVAARALGRVEDPAAAPALLRALTGRRRVPASIVGHSLAQLGQGAEKSLVSALGDRQGQVRAVAADILGFAGAVGAAPALEARVEQDPDLRVRVRAAQALGRLEVSSACTVLEAMTVDTHPVPLRAVAARALGKIGSKASVPTLRRLLFDHSHEVAHEAAAALERCGPAGDAALREVALLDLPAGARTTSAFVRAAGHAREAIAQGDPGRWHADVDAYALLTLEPGRSRAGTAPP